MLKRFFGWLKRIENLRPLQAIRKGLVMLIPVLTIGAVALILNNLPIPGYQDFIAEFAGGLLTRLFTFINEATYGFLSIYMTISITTAYAQLLSDRRQPLFVLGAIAAAMVTFAIFSGVISDNMTAVGSVDHTCVNITALGVQGMFTAIFSSLTVTPLFAALCRKKLFRLRLYSDGSDASFTNAVSVILPFLICVAGAALINWGIGMLLGVTSFQGLFVKLVNLLFKNSAADLAGGLLYVALSSVLWFFGIHGSDVLENVAANVFTTWETPAGGLLVNKTFIDVFVLMGGCGAAICLLAAIVLFAKRRNARDLSKLAAGPMIFNVNEIMTFGLPVVLNPRFFIPFLLTPIVCLLTTSLAMWLGLVPPVSSEVVWTTPILWSGYLATGSWAGSVLQLVNLVLGTLIYRPFVRADEKQKLKNSRAKLDSMVALCKEADERVEDVELLKRIDGVGEVSRMLASDLKQAIADDTLRMYYQPHHDRHGKCVGAEALLRWQHPNFGMIYPPLVIRLATEAGLLLELERKIFDRTVSEIAGFAPYHGEPFKVAVNITPVSLRDESGIKYLAGLLGKYGVRPEQLVIEITEQMAVEWDAATEGILATIHEMGVGLAIDDFSMGHTSIKYMQSKHFSIIKLDGSLVRSMDQGKRFEDIVSSLISLSRELDFEVVAECVETKEQFDRLNALGCQQYQGYYFSPAMDCDSFKQYLLRHSKDKRNETHNA